MDERRRRFEQLVLPHLDAAYNLARWLSRAEAEDVVQDAVLRAFRAFDGFRGGDARPWLLAIVRNCHYTAAGRRAATAAWSFPTRTRCDSGRRARSGSAGDRGATGRASSTSRSALPAEYREALILREMEDMSYREIAETTGVPIGTVMSRLARARALLRERWLADMEKGRHDVRATAARAGLSMASSMRSALAVEQHLETCAECRALQADIICCARP